MKATKHPDLQPTPETPHFLVRAKHYWGRGETVADAIKAAKWLNRGDVVHVARVDENASCGEISGELRYTKRSPIFVGKIASKGDIDITGKYKD